MKILKKLEKKVFFRNSYNSRLIPSANIYINDLKEYNQLKKYLNANLKKSFIEYKFPKIKIINKKYNKLNVISVIKKLEKIEDRNIYTIGDDTNDIEMILKYDGYSLTTAKEEVKKIASKIYEGLNQLIEYIN